MSDFKGLNRDLGFIIGALSLVVVAIGAVIGVAVDVLLHRHRRAR